MTTNSQLSTIEPKKNNNKNELSKQLDHKQIHRHRDHMEGCQQARMGRDGGKCTGNKKYKWQVQNRQGEVNSMGSGEAKELICMTHGHDQRLGNDGGKRVQGKG